MPRSKPSGPAEMIGARELRALEKAANDRGGWSRYRQPTTAKLAALGYFELAHHPLHGERWRITEAGRAALARLTAPMRDRN